MKIVIIADIHGNLEAARSLRNRLQQIDKIDGMVLLGDLIDYGPHSDEVIGLIRDLPYPVLCNIWGNHEDAIIKGQYQRFSTERGKDCARHTRNHLSDGSRDYIEKEMTGEGKAEFWIRGKKCLAVHGSLADEYWKGIHPEDNLDQYSGYDYVFSGHTHLPHFFEKYYPAEDVRKRNQKKTIFINPGSAGQPRNLNAMAQCAVLNVESEEITMMKCHYDIRREQGAFSTAVDTFYKNRLEYGV